MFAVTFYSYKGGVGRTMALVNTAFTFAKKGRKVLVIDFDLEAPGVETYPQLNAAARRPGLVDYVCEYMATGRAPDASQYIFECVRDDDSGGSVWVMPAGHRDDTYLQKFASIDWLALYRDHQGFLMFEDLKQQLQGEDGKRFDYVLIDSRTGHTDVGGICTRQLPDAVVMMFYPNEQNIYGLAIAAKDIREEERGSQRTIKLLFTPSNVPLLDDENGILQERLDFSQRTLQYSKPAAIIRHYASLDFMNQSVFVEDRPKTSLANEYRALAAAIARENIEDREGAISALDQIKERYRREQEAVPVAGELQLATSSSSKLTETAETIAKIQAVHAHDPEIAWQLAPLFSQLGDLESEFEALSIAMHAESRRGQALRLRAMNLLARGATTEARADLIEVMSSGEAKSFDLLTALELLRSIEPTTWIERIDFEKIFSRLDSDDQIRVLDHLPVDRQASNLAAKLTLRIKHDRHLALLVSNLRTISLIGALRFDEAITTIGKTRDEIEGSGNIQEVFNYAMAEWGSSKCPPKDLLQRVTSLGSERRRGHEGANYNQCLGLAYGVLGQSRAAEEFLHRALDQLGPGSIFSCWRYLKVNRSEMKDDLRTMLELSQSGSPMIPTFLTV